MKRTKIIGLLAVLAIVVAACGDSDAGDTTTTAATPDTTEAPAETTTTAAPADTTTTADDGEEDNPLAEFGEDPSAADMALVEKALGDVTPSDEESWNIILASVARAHQNLDQATIDKALECWSQPECDTGSGGELVMGYADGGGHLNVWRGVTHMEAILQALTYPEIGTIVSQEALWQYDPAIHQGQFDFLLQYPVDFIVGYPDYPELVVDKIREATEAGVPYVPFSGGWVGIPGVHDFALTPGEGYLTVVGEDLCALGESFAEVLNENVPDGEIALLGGTTGNGLTLGWQQCLVPAVTSTVVNPPPDELTTVGDTNWLNDQAQQVVSGLVSANENISGFAYEYADGMNDAIRFTYEPDGNVEFPESLTLAMRTDEQTLFCDWAERGQPGYRIFFSAGGNFQSRTAVTAAMMSLQGADLPAEIVVPHVMREVTEDHCDPNRATDTVSGTSLVPDEVLEAMFSEG